VLSAETINYDINNICLKLNVLNVIRNEGVATKQFVSRMLNFNLTTVSHLINELHLSAGLLEVSGDDLSSGGRKPKLYRINSKAGFLVGVDIGGENLRFLLTDISGNIVFKIKKKNEFANSENKLMQDILENINNVIKDSGVAPGKIYGAGLSISGIIDSDNGKSVYCPNIDALNDFYIKKYIEEKTGIHTFVDDSVRCMTVAEKHYGAAKNYENFLFVGLGKGIGLGIYVNGKIYRGSNGLSGELGHITVAEDGPICNCGNKGCLEAIASSSGILKRATDGIKNKIATSLITKVQGDISKLTVEDISDAANAGDKFAYYIINRTGEYIGIAIAAALNLFGTELVVLGGGISQSGEIMINAIKRIVHMRALEVVSKKTKVIKSELDEYNAAWGAATKYINILFKDKDYNLIRRMNLK